MRSFGSAILLVAAFIPAASQLNAQTNQPATNTSTATYQLEFISTWSPTTHPDNFPPGAHYSPLIGATHNESGLLWSVDSLASPGIESMAETGGTATLSAEVEAFQNAGTAMFLVNGPGLNTTPDDAQLTFDISSSHPLFSIVSMVAPSPDWFVGINSINLLDSGNWVDSASVVAYVYDAGTDDGATYTSANLEADPHQPVSLIDEPPFAASDTIAAAGIFKLSLLSVLDTDPDRPLSSLVVDSPFPNPFGNSTTVALQADVPVAACVEMYDLLGRRIREVFNGTVSGRVELEISGTDLSPGIYLIRIKTDKSSTSKPVILAR